VLLTSTNSLTRIHYYRYCKDVLITAGGTKPSGIFAHYVMPAFSSRDGSQSTNVCNRWMSLLNAEGKANTWKASDPSKSDDDIDDLFGIPPCLVSEGANLSQYRDESLSQTSKHAMAMEQPIPSAWINPAGDTTLAHGGSL
jgi:hypothetical protein